MIKAISKCIYIFCRSWTVKYTFRLSYYGDRIPKIQTIFDSCIIIFLLNQVSTWQTLDPLLRWQIFINGGRILQLDNIVHKYIYHLSRLSHQYYFDLCDKIVPTNNDQTLFCLKINHLYFEHWNYFSYSVKKW